MQVLGEASRKDPFASPDVQHPSDIQGYPGTALS